MPNSKVVLRLGWDAAADEILLNRSYISKFRLPPSDLFIFESLSFLLLKSQIFSKCPVSAVAGTAVFVAQVCGAYAGCISGVLRLKSLDAALHIIATSRVLALHRSRVREKKKIANALLLTLSLEHVHTHQEFYSRIGY